MTARTATRCTTRRRRWRPATTRHSSRPCASTPEPARCRVMNFRLLAMALGVLALLAPASAQTPGLGSIARVPGTPEIPGLRVVWLAPWGELSKAHPWKNIIVHQTEGPAGSARGGAREQVRNPTRRGVTVWVETDGTVFWAVPENLVPTHGDGANRN